MSVFKVKLYALFSAIGVFLLGMLKFLSFRNKQLKKENKQLHADIQFRKDVDEADEAIDQVYSHKAELAKEALKNDEIPEHLRNPRQ